jgi:hypothetical protein
MTRSIPAAFNCSSERRFQALYADAANAIVADRAAMVRVSTTIVPHRRHVRRKLIEVRSRIVMDYST